MARTKSSVVVGLEYGLLRGLFRFLQVIPISGCYWLCRFLLSLVLFFIPKRRQLIQEQLERSFPQKTPQECRLIGKESLDNLARGFARYARIPLMTDREMEDMVEIEGFEHIREAFRQGKGMITFTAHFGFWELMAIYVTRLYPKIAMVVRPLDNPRLDAMVTSVRSAGGGGVIDSRKVFKEGLRLLRDNGILGVLIDQNFYKGGVFVNFFGRPAATNTLVPILARRTGCAVLPMHNVWIGNKIRIICGAPVTLSESADAQAAITEDTQKLTSIVEAWIREDPGQWMWLHNRWKRKPD